MDSFRCSSMPDFLLIRGPEFGDTYKKVEVLSWPALLSEICFHTSEDAGALLTIGEDCRLS